MRKITLIVIAVVFSFVSNAGIVYVPGNESDNYKASKNTSNEVLGQLDAKTFLTLTPSQVQKLTGKRMNFTQKLSLKLAQMNVKKQLKRGKNVNISDAMNKADGTAGKSQLVALILAILVGGLGIHRFYLGYIGIGIIQLLTLGGLGIWALIDLIMIATGDLKPKNGEYEKTL
jgi:TM2 domain-containing membrane protein YozV